MPAIRFVIRSYTRDGLSLGFELVAVDANGEVDTSFTGTVNFSGVNSTIPGLPSSYTFTAGDAGARRFSTTIQTIENVQIFATDAGGTLATAGIYIGGNGPDNFIGGNGGDVFDPSGGTNNPLTGNDGEDTFYLRGGINTIAGGAGVDRLIFDLRGNGFGLRNQSGVPIEPDPSGGMQGAYTNGQDASVNFTGIENITILTNNNAEDNLTTGSGDDEYSQVALDSPFYIRDFVDLGDGVDTVSVDARGTNGSLSFLALNANGSGEIGLYGNGKLGFLNAERFFMQGGNAADDLRGLNLADRFEGNGGADRLDGRGGNDVLHGGRGGDLMIGGAGDDIFYVDQAGDQAIEVQGEGTDTVYSASLSFTAGAHVENLVAALTAGPTSTSAEVQANSLVTGGNQFINGIAALNDGGYVVTWWEQPSNDVRARVFNADGTGRSAEFLVDSSSAGNQGQYGVSTTALANGGFLVAHYFTPGSPNDEAIIGRVFDANGVAQGAEFTLTDAVGLYDSFPNLVKLDNGQIALISQNSQSDGNGTFTVNLQLLNADGIPTGASMRLNTTTTGEQVGPSAALLDDGRVIVVWESGEAGGTVFRGRYLDAAGNPVGSDFALTTPGGPGPNEGTTRIDVTAVAGGGFAIGWWGNGDVQGRVFDSTGAPLGAQFVLSSNAADTQESISLTRLPEGGFMASWTSFGGRDGSDLAMIGRLFNADGTPRGDDFVVNQITDAYQVGALLTTLADGRIAAAFSSEAFHRGDYDVKTLTLDTTPNQAIIGGETANRVTGGYGNDLIVGGGGNDTLIGGRGNDVIMGGALATTGANLIVNGGFETQDGNNVTRDWILAAPFGTFEGVAYRQTGGLFGWQTNGQPAELNTQNGSTQFIPVEGTANLNMDFGNTNLAVFQDLSGLAAGETYLLRFAASQPQYGATNYSAQLDVYWNGTLMATVTPSAKEAAFYTVALTAAAVGSGTGGANRIEFREISSQDGAGTTLDAISLHATTAGADTGADVAAGSQPNLLINGSFEQFDANTSARDYVLASPSSDHNGGEPLYRVSSTLFGWSFLPGTTRIEFNTDGTAPSNEFTTADGTVVLDMEVSNGENNGIYQDVAGLAAGSRYRIDLSAALGVGPGQSAQLDVYWNGALIGSVTPASTTFSAYSFDVFAAAAGTGAGGANRLTLQEVGANSARGTALDNVKLTLVATPDATSIDTVDYSAETGGGDIIVNMSAISINVGATTVAAGRAIDSYGATDTLSGIENVMSGGGNDTLIGNAAANVLTSGSGNDTLDGGAGIDTLMGGTGDDFYFVDTGDVITEAAGEGTDRVFARANYVLTAGAEIERMSTAEHVGTEAINITGNALFQLIFGNAGNNVLDGGGGNDELIGLGGNDSYYVSAGDLVTEYVGGGNDRVYARTDYTLWATREIETLSTDNDAATVARNLTGNDLNQTIIGNAGFNIIDGGGGGGDTLRGLAGDDWYFVRSGDAIEEAANGGNDRLFAIGTYALANGASIELMSTSDHSGTTAYNLFGNELEQTIYGNAGDNVIDGGFGADVLVGLGGANTFSFTSRLGDGNIDRIIDFVSGTDRIALDDTVYTALTPGALPAGAFVVGSAAQDGDDRIVYNQTTGALYYDVDGSGGAAAVQFATLNAGQVLVASDFIVI